MTTEQFVYWLQGFLELSGATTLNEQQIQVIKEHIALVLTKVTPSGVTPVPAITVPNTLSLPWLITCTAENKNIDLSSSPVTVSSDMVQDLKAFTGIDLNNAPVVDVPTCLSC